MWGGFQALANKALAALPTKEDLLREVEKVKVFADLDALKESPEEQKEQQRKRHARDLGMTFAMERLILMGRPHKGLTRGGRVELTSASAFFRQHYPGKFMVWNLSGSAYDFAMLDNQVWPEFCCSCVQRKDCVFVV